MWDQKWKVEATERQVGRRVDGSHAGHRSRLVHIDRRDPGVRVRRPNEAAFESAFIDIVGEAPAPAQQTVVLDALHWRAEPAGRHFDNSTARVTARRIDA